MQHRPETTAYTDHTCYRCGGIVALVVADMSISLDGYVTGPNDSRENPFGDGAGMLHDWLDAAATDEDRAILQQFADGVGAVVMGRTSFEKNEGDGGWGDGGPAGDVPCLVVTHHLPSRPYPSVFTFVTDGVASAIEQAQRAAGGKLVCLFGATVLQQALPLGLVDEIHLHVVASLIVAGTHCSARSRRGSASNAPTWRLPRRRRTSSSAYCDRPPSTTQRAFRTGPRRRVLPHREPPSCTKHRPTPVVRTLPARSPKESS